MAEGMVIVKFLGKKTLTINMYAWHPWVFDPFCEMSMKEYVGAKGYWVENAADFRLAEPGEYEAHVQAVEDKLAEIHYCGDSGGETAKGFCAKKTCGGERLKYGERCEHHGGLEKGQGSYGPPVERPTYEKRGAAPTGE